MHACGSVPVVIVLLLRPLMAGAPLQVLKNQSSLHHCWNALLIFDSRKVEPEKAHVTQVFNSLTTAIDTNIGQTVAAVLFGSCTTVESQENYVAVQQSRAKRTMNARLSRLRCQATLPVSF